MSTHDYVIANQTGANTRSYLNNAFSAIVSNNSSASEPATMYAYQWWADTANDLLKQRNAANSAWISILTLSTGAVTSGGDPTMGGDLTGTASNAQIAANAVGLAEMAGGTDGNLITYDASGDPAYVTTGTSGQILTSGGTGVAPTFQTAAGGGKVLQVVGTMISSQPSTSSTSWVTTGQSLSITPSLTTSKVLVMFGANSIYYANYQGNVTLYRDSTNLGDSDSGLQYMYGVGGGSGSTSKSVSFSLLDSPNTSSSVAYTLYFKSRNSSGVVRSNSGSSVFPITLMEIGA